MPRWVPRAIFLLWLGFLGTVLVQELWDRLFGFFLLLVISLFIALAIEPGTNRLARRGMSRALRPASSSEPSLWWPSGSSPSWAPSSPTRQANSPTIATAT